MLKNKEQLESLSLDVPFAYKISEGLKKQGIQIETYINQEKLVKKLCQLHSKK